MCAAPTRRAERRGQTCPLCSQPGKPGFQLQPPTCQPVIWQVTSPPWASVSSPAEVDTNPRHGRVSGLSEAAGMKGPAPGCPVTVLTHLSLPYGFPTVWPQCRVVVTPKHPSFGFVTTGLWVLLQVCQGPSNREGDRKICPLYTSNIILSI